MVTARDFCEGYQNRAYITQTWEASFDTWPEFPVRLPKGQLQNIVSISYIDVDGNTATLDPLAYICATGDDGRLTWAYNAQKPTVQLRSIDAVRVRFNCGYGDDAASVPKRVVQAMKMLLLHWFENPGPLNVSKDFVNEVPWTVKTLLDLDRLVPV
jgi:uncharacterized phiE125 gp8 family phage protein